MFRRVIGAVVAAFAVAAPAFAKGGNPFDRESARAGDAISVGVTEVGAAWPELSARVDVYLVPITAAPRWWTTYTSYGPTYGPRPQLKSAVYLGGVPHVGWRTPRLRTRVPRVAPGKYVLAYWVGAVEARWTSALPNYQVGADSVLRVRR